MTGKARILFVDDEKRVLNAMRGLFRRDYELFLTSEGAEAIRLVTENDVDVIVADQRMPGMTGIEVLGQVKKKSPRTVRILLTGYADPTAVEGSINIGEVFRFLSKPCPPKMLRETLSLAVGAARTAPAKPTAPQATEEQTPRPVAEQQPAPVVAPIAAPAEEPVAPPMEEAVMAPMEEAVVAPAVEPKTSPVAPEQPAEAPASYEETEKIPPAQHEAVAQQTSEQSAADDVSSEQYYEDTDATHPALPILDENAIKSTADHSTTHWQSVTNVVMSEDNVEETQENVALTADTQGVGDVGVAIFTVDSDFASTAIRAISPQRDTILATTLVKVAHAIEEQNAGVLVTDFTTNSTMLQKMISTLKQHMPELVTIVVSSGRDTTDMINLINYGQVFRYVLKPIEPEELRADINAAVLHHLYLLNNPDSAKRHQVIEAPDTGESSTTLNKFLGKFRKTRQSDPTDTIA